MSLLKFALILSLITSCLNCLQLGVISYWSVENDYDSLPENCVGLINPSNGIINADDQILAKFQNIVQNVKRAKGDKVKLFGYVPTGYGNRNTRPIETIQKDIDLYFEKFAANINGIFFDEIGSNCKTVKSDMQILRDYIKSRKSNAIITWNPGYVGNDWCYIADGAANGEIVMDFESAFDKYMNISTGWDLNPAKDKAKERGVLTWHAIHTAKTEDDMKQAVAKAKEYGADYVFVTNIGGNWQQGENTFGSPPSYWAQEIETVKQLN